MSNTETRPIVPAKKLNTDYPVRLSLQKHCYLKLTRTLQADRQWPVRLDEDNIIPRSLLTTTLRHFTRVLKYARPEDYAWGALMSTFGPTLMLTWERISPSYVGRGGFAPLMRLSWAIGLGAGFYSVYQQSTGTNLSIYKRKPEGWYCYSNSTILRLHWKRTRARNGYERDGW